MEYHWGLWKFLASSDDHERFLKIVEVSGDPGRFWKIVEVLLRSQKVFENSGSFSLEILRVYWRLRMFFECYGNFLKIMVFFFWRFSVSYRLRKFFEDYENFLKIMAVFFLEILRLLPQIAEIFWILWNFLRYWRLRILVVVYWRLK